MTVETKQPLTPTVVDGPTRFRSAGNGTVPTSGSACPLSANDALPTVSKVMLPHQAGRTEKRSTQGDADVGARQLSEQWIKRPAAEIVTL